jgi:L-threonylcarbamoyladenylate synthase
MINKEQAIKAVFDMKNRPLDHPLIVHVAEDWDISAIVDYIPDYAKSLMKEFWPGPLTLVLRSKTGNINPLITGGQTTVALRCPAHPLAQQLLKKLNVPVVAPSANPFGKISPTTALHVHNSFKDRELTILDGGRCGVGIESVIVDATAPNSYQILRHGLIDERAIEAIISTPCRDELNDIRVPGKLDSHYQPQKPLWYFEDYETLSQFCQNKGNEIYVIATQKPEGVATAYFHQFADHADKAAYDLYYQLREADASTAQCIAIELPPATGEWQGIRERILKAGAPCN